MAALAQDPLVALPASDPLSNYTQSTFAQYVNSVFTLRAAQRNIEVTLMKVEDSLPAKVSRAGGRESFTLHFRGGGIALPQDTYIIEHPALGTFNLFLVPSGADENGAQGYVAVINRLPYNAGLPAPERKPFTRKSSPTAKPGVDTPATPAVETPTKTTPVKPRKGNSEL
jgi:hypothetical protein